MRDDAYCMTNKRLAIGLLQDLSGNLKEHFGQQLEIVVPLLLEVLRHEYLDVDIKTNAIMALGDICLICEHQFHPYIMQTMQLLVEAG